MQHKVTRCITWRFSILTLHEQQERWIKTNTRSSFSQRWIDFSSRTASDRISEWLKAFLTMEINRKRAQMPETNSPPSKVAKIAPSDNEDPPLVTAHGVSSSSKAFPTSGYNPPSLSPVSKFEPPHPPPRSRSTRIVHRKDLFRPTAKGTDPPLICIAKKARVDLYTHDHITPDQCRLLYIKPGKGTNEISATMITVVDEQLGENYPYEALSYH